MIRRSLYTSQVAIKAYKTGQHRPKDLQSSFAKITKVSPVYSEKYAKMQKTKSGMWKRQRVDETFRGAMEPVWKDKSKYQKKSEWINEQQNEIAPDILRKRRVGVKGIPVGARHLIKASKRQFDFEEESLVTNFITKYYDSNPIAEIKIMKLIKRDHRTINIDFTIYGDDFSVTNTSKSEENRRADLAKKQLRVSAKKIKPLLKGLFFAKDLWIGLRLIIFFIKFFRPDRRNLRHW